MATSTLEKHEVKHRRKGTRPPAIAPQPDGLLIVDVTCPEAVSAIFTRADIDDLCECWREWRGESEGDEELGEFWFQLASGHTVYINLDGIDSEAEIRENPRRLLSVPDDHLWWEHDVGGERVTWVLNVSQPRKKYLMGEFAKELKRRGYRVVTLRRPDNFALTPPAHQTAPWYDGEQFSANGHRARRDEETGRLVPLSDASAKPTVIQDFQEHTVVDEVCAALAKSRGLYQRAGELVRVSRPGEIQVLAKPTIREEITRACSLVVDTEDGMKPQRPAEWLPGAVMSRAFYPGMPELKAVSYCPFVRPDGTIHFRNGYDAVTQVFQKTNAIFPMPYAQTNEIPSSLELATAYAKHAAGRLAEIFADFPFDDEPGAAPHNLAAMLAALLTPFGRFAFTGPTPIVVITKNAPGVGGSLLADCVHMLVTGRRAPRQAVPHDDSEMKKLLLATAREGATIKLLDNCPDGAFGCASLDAVATSTSITDRVLGESRVVTYPWSTVLFLTGNNVAIRGDTGRRLLPVNLKTREQDPESRTGFAHPDLLGWLEENRPQLAMDACMLLSAYILSGKPDVGVRPLGSFEGWSTTVRNAVIFAGFPDPCGTREAFRAAADRDSNLLPMLIDGLAELIQACGGSALTTAEIIREASIRSECEIIRVALQELASRGKPIDARGLGMRLHHHKSRNFGGKSIERKNGPHNSILWFVKSENPETTAGEPHRVGLNGNLF